MIAAAAVAAQSPLTTAYMVLAIVVSVVTIQGTAAAIYARKTKSKREEREQRDKDIAKTLLWVNGIPADESIDGVEIRPAPIQLHDLSVNVDKLIGLVGENGKSLTGNVEDLAISLKDISTRLDAHIHDTKPARTRRAVPAGKVTK